MGTEPLKNDQGRVSIGCVVLTFLLAVAAYHLYLFGMPFVRHYFFQEKIEAFIEDTRHQELEFVYELTMAAAAEAGVSILKKDIIFERDRYSVHIRVEYEVPVATPIIKRTLPFKAESSRRFTG
jgi:hypothetical protein